MYQCLFSFFFLTQEDNGVPVHLKAGASDALLYRLTMALTVGGKTLFECFQDRSISDSSFL